MHGHSKLRQRLIRAEHMVWSGSTPLSDKLDVVAPRLALLLDQATIGIPYTPHGFAHVLEVDSLADELLEHLPDDCPPLNDCYNLYILTLAIWFHDAGLIQSSDREKTQQIRDFHHLRVQPVLARNFQDIFDEFEIKWIATVGGSHRQDDVDRLPKQIPIDRRILTSPLPQHFSLWPQLIAAILRICDICAIGNTRTPWHLYRSYELDQKAEEHWRAHLSVDSVCFQTNSAGQPTVAISVSHSSFSLVQHMRRHVTEVEDEIRVCNRALSSVSLPTLASSVDLQVHEHEILSQQQFTVLPSGLYDLLSRGLYGSDDVFIRELVQNALDATSRQRAIDNEVQPDRIDIDVSYDGLRSPENIRSIVFRDYGVGMDQGAIDSYLLQIAAKASDNPEEIEDLAEAGIDPLIQEWGIGFLSVFAVTPDVTVRTHRAGMRPVLAKFIPRSAEEILADSSIGDIDCFLQEDSAPLQEVDRGTEVELHLSGGLQFDPLDRLRHYVRFPLVAIRYREHGTSPHQIDMPAGRPSPAEGAALVDDENLRSGWISLSDEGYQPGVLLTQAGLLVEEHVTDLLVQERLSLSGEIDCRSRFLKLPASRNRAIREASSWADLQSVVRETIPAAISAYLDRRREPVVVNQPLPDPLAQAIDAVQRVESDEVQRRALLAVRERSVFALAKQKAHSSQLAEAVRKSGDTSIYVMSQGTTADGSQYLRGHVKFGNIQIWLPAVTAQDARAEFLQGEGKLLLPVVPKDWTMGSKGYENRWLIFQLAAMADIAVNEDLVDDEYKRFEYSPVARNDTLRSIWNKSDWSSFGTSVRAICVDHRSWEFVFVMNSDAPAIQKLKELWERNEELRPLIRLLVECYCEALRINPGAVVEAIEDFVREGLQALSAGNPSATSSDYSGNE